jgi:hypothetical protein
MAGLWKDLPYKVTKKVKENWIDTLFFLVPVIGTYECVPTQTSLRTGPGEPAWHNAGLLRAALRAVAGQLLTQRGGARGAGWKQP